MITVNTKPKGIYIAKTLVFITVGVCLVVVLLVGLLCGLLARNNCSDDKPPTTTTFITIPSTSTPTGKNSNQF